MQSYAKAGEFTFLGKFKYALFVNAVYYGTYLIIFGCCLVYLAATSRLAFDLWVFPGRRCLAGFGDD